MGRPDLLDRLHQTLRAHGRAVLTGAPGAGRSAVLDVVARTAESRGETVLRLAPAERDRAVPGAAATALLAAIPTAALAPLPGMSFRAVPGSLPAPGAGTGLRSGRGTRPGADGTGTARTIPRTSGGRSTGRARRGGPLGAAPAASVPALLRRLAGEWPVLLVIDDAQWLDEESVLLLRSVLHPGAGTVPAELRLLIAERTAPGAPREAVAPALCGAAPRDTIALPPLDTAATAELLARHRLPRRLTDAVHRASGGNPARALAVARTLSATPSPELAAG
ncbi:AAA family ATPase [Streptomyces albus]|uniref:AAA family ATPase n=1 Tax=Streptomyces albus TaxID=1888 RepID=UPI0004C6C2F1|nr:AAA family ATPase [Streptomyces albus]